MCKAGGILAFCATRRIDDNFGYYNKSKDQKESSKARVKTYVEKPSEVDEVCMRDIRNTALSMCYLGHPSSLAVKAMLMLKEIEKERVNPNVA